LLAESGSSGDVTIAASGGGAVDLKDLPVANADIEASGGSTVIVHPSGELNARVSGGARVYYLGSPTLGEIDADISASVERK
jgi:hypothetical protein